MTVGRYGLYIGLSLSLPALARENAWFCITAKRTNQVSSIGGGISQVMGCIMKSYHARDVGIVLTFPGGEQRRLFIRMGFIVQDGDAHKRVHWCKGDAGMKLCMICRNLHSIKSAVVGEDGSNLLTCRFVNEAEIEFATGAEIRGSVRRLAAWKGFESNPLFNAREQAYGFTHSPHNLLLDLSLDHVYD